MARLAFWHGELEESGLIMASDTILKLRTLANRTGSMGGPETCILLDVSFCEQHLMHRDLSGQPVADFLSLDACH